MQATGNEFFPHNRCSVNNANVESAMPKGLDEERFILLTFLFIHGLSCLLKRFTNLILVLLVLSAMKLMSFLTE
jgi:hypothetical protein